jgi:hypothetical protein
MSIVDSHPFRKGREMDGARSFQIPESGFDICLVVSHPNVVSQKFIEKQPQIPLRLRSEVVTKFVQRAFLSSIGLAHGF